MLLHFEGLIQFNANSLAANHTIAVAPAVEMATYDRRTRRWKGAEDTEMTFKRSIHQLTCGGIVHVQAMLAYHVTLAVRLCWESHRALRTPVWLLTYSANKHCLSSTQWHGL